MKTSFYFVLWITVSAILWMYNNSGINQYFFLASFVVVIAVALLINMLISKLLAYENALETHPILEDLYNGNVISFKKRLSQDTKIEIITAIYLFVTTIVALVLCFNADDWFALVLFGVLFYKSVVKCVKLVKGCFILKSNPTPAQCVEVAETAYDVNYGEYYDERKGADFKSTLPEKPKGYIVFRIFSIVIAVISAMLGLIIIAKGVMDLVYVYSMSDYISFCHYYLSIAVIYFISGSLYGSLALYFGIRDFASCIRKNKYLKVVGKSEAA